MTETDDFTMRDVTIRLPNNSVKSMQAMTLVELLIVIIIIGVISVTAAPAFLNRGGFEQQTFQAELISALRLTQQRAMQDATQACYGVNFQATQITPSLCGAAVATERVIVVPSANGLSVNASLSNISNGLRFNSLGCPVSTNHSTSTPELCGQSAVEITLTGPNSKTVCVQSQGYIRKGACN